MALICHVLTIKTKLRAQRAETYSYWFMVDVDIDLDLLDLIYKANTCRHRSRSYFLHPILFSLGRELFIFSHTYFAHS